MRDKLLRIRQICNTGELFNGYDISKAQETEILDFMNEKKEILREMSLRMALKIADLTKVSPNWKELAESTVMRRR